MTFYNCLAFSSIFYHFLSSVKCQVYQASSIKINGRRLLYFISWDSEKSHCPKSRRPHRNPSPWPRMATWAYSWPWPAPRLFVHQFPSSIEYQVSSVKCGWWSWDGPRLDTRLYHETKQYSMTRLMAMAKPELVQLTLILRIDQYLTLDIIIRNEQTRK